MQNESLSHTHTHHLPPLAYSITRNSVFSVSITSNSLTIKRETGKYRGEEKIINRGEKEAKEKGFFKVKSGTNFEIFKTV